MKNSAPVVLVAKICEAGLRAQLDRLADEHGATRDDAAGGALQFRFPEALPCLRAALAMRQRVEDWNAISREMGARDNAVLRLSMAQDVRTAMRLQTADRSAPVLVANDTFAPLADHAIATEVPALDAWSVIAEADAPDVTRKVFQWQRLGLRVLLDLERMPARERAKAIHANRVIAARGPQARPNGAHSRHGHTAPVATAIRREHQFPHPLPDDQHRALLVPAVLPPAAEHGGHP